MSRFLAFGCFVCTLSFLWAACTPSTEATLQQTDREKSGDRITDQQLAADTDWPTDSKQLDGGAYEPERDFDESSLADVGVVSYFTGNAVDARIQLNASSGALLLMGGGADVDAAFTQRVKEHIGTGADVVVLRTTGSDGYNDYLLDLLEANSVETFIVDSKAKANSRQLYESIKAAEFIWLAGGDQSEYHGFWTGTAAQYFVQDLYARGGVVGGTSAGMAALSPVSYNPDGVAGAITEEVLADFCHPTLKFAEKFFQPKLPLYLTDTHFDERDRMGRLVTFLGHHAAKKPLGIGADENASIFITADGNGVVDGLASVYVLETDNSDFSGSKCGGPTVASNIQKVRLTAGQNYNFLNKTTTGTRTVLNVDGSMTTPYMPQNPYQ